MKEFRATSITVDTEAQTLSVCWADGHVSCFPLDGLRKACPCATCKGGHAFMGAPPDPEVFDAAPDRRWERLRAAPVGSYALRITWDDGHDTGIYQWKSLRAWCPCSECRGE